jgi:hypothetical protein
MVKRKQQHGGENEGLFSNWFNNKSEEPSEYSEHKEQSGLFSGLFGHSSSSEHKETNGFFGNSSKHLPSSEHSSGITFQKIVSYIAAIILAGTLTVIGFMVYNSKTSMKYPPEVAECPDYWESIGPGKCRNTLKVGKCTETDEMNFNDPKYSGPTGLAEKCKWANSCGLVWDGLKC